MKTAEADFFVPIVAVLVGAFATDTFLCILLVSILPWLTDALTLVAVLLLVLSFRGLPWLSGGTVGRILAAFGDG